MKAIIRGSAGLLALLLLCSASFGYYFITPVSKVPYPQAPNTFNSQVYYYDAWGRLIGPYYALTPPFPPHTMPLPGPIGQAINSGYLPHTLLLDKKAMTVGNAPMLGHHGPKHGGAPQPGPGGPGGPMQYPTVGGSDVASRGPAQMPYMGVPTSPYPMQSPYAMGPGVYGTTPMPYGPMPYPGPMGMRQGPPMHPAQYPGPMNPPGAAMQMPYSVPTAPAPVMGSWYTPQAGTMPMTPSPHPSVMPPWLMQNPYQPFIKPTANWNYYAPNYSYQRHPYTGQIVLVQNVMPAPMPIMPIPGFNPAMPAMPAMPVMPANPAIPAMPSQPRMDMGPYEGFQYFGPIQQFDPMNPLQGPRPPQMEFQPLQAPRMEMGPPPQIKGGGSAYPVHPFIRSPRDFFMWGDTMEEERTRGSRPNPVP